MVLDRDAFQKFPGPVGVNTSLDKAIIGPDKLVQADNVEYGETENFTVTKKREGINENWDDRPGASNDILGIYDYWYYSSGKKQKVIAVASDTNAVYSYDISSGARTTLTIGAGATSITSPTKCSMTAINNLVIIATDGDTNVLMKYAGSGDVENLGGTPPKGSILQTHLGRLWTNDKTDPDKLHYSTTFNPEEWNGSGDSGALFIGVGDNDPEGITAIFPTMHGALYVAKRTKLYRITGNTPDNFRIDLMSNNIGCISHNSVAQIAKDDIFWLSDKGVHALTSVLASNDNTAETFISFDIQETVNKKWTQSRREFSWGTYLDRKNTYFLAVTDSDHSSTNNQVIWAYNVPLKAWFKWITDKSCESMAVLTESDKKRVFLGTDGERLTRTDTASYADVDTAGSDQAYTMTLKTGRIYPSQTPYVANTFDRFGLYSRVNGNQTVTVDFKVDDFPAQTISYSNSLPVLGSFTLGTDALSPEQDVVPNTVTIDGLGRGFELTISSGTVDEQVEIHGYVVQFRKAGLKQETTTSAGSTDPV